MTIHAVYPSHLPGHPSSAEAHLRHLGQSADTSNPASASLSNGSQGMSRSAAAIAPSTSGEAKYAPKDLSKGWRKMDACANGSASSDGSEASRPDQNDSCSGNESESQDGTDCKKLSQSHCKSISEHHTQSGSIYDSESEESERESESDSGRDDSSPASEGPNASDAVRDKQAEADHSEPAAFARLDAIFSATIDTGALRSMVDQASCTCHLRKAPLMKSPSLAGNSFHSCASWLISTSL